VRHQRHIQAASHARKCAARSRQGKCGKGIQAASRRAAARSRQAGARARRSVARRPQGSIQAVHNHPYPGKASIQAAGPGGGPGQHPGKCVQRAGGAVQLRPQVRRAQTRGAAATAVEHPSAVQASRQRPEASRAGPGRTQASMLSEGRSRASRQAVQASRQGPGKVQAVLSGKVQAAVQALFFW
jgi:hypothetical protein